MDQEQLLLTAVANSTDDFVFIYSPPPPRLAESASAQDLFIFFPDSVALPTPHAGPPPSPAYLLMLATEPVLRREWDTPEEDAAWAHL